MHVRIYGIRMNVYTTPEIYINKQIQPNFLFDVDSFNMALNCINDESNQRLIVN